MCHVAVDDSGGDYYCCYAGADGMTNNLLHILVQSLRHTILPRHRRRPHHLPDHPGAGRDRRGRQSYRRRAADEEGDDEAGGGNVAVGVDEDYGGGVGRRRRLR